MSAPAQDVRIRQNSAPMHQPWFDLKIKVIGFSWKSGRTVGRKRFAQVCPACTVPALLPTTSKPGEDFVDPAGDSLLPVLTFGCPMSMHHPKLSFPPHPSLVRTFLKYPPHRHDGDEHGVFDDNNNDELMVMYEPYYKSGKKSTNQ